MALDATNARVGITGAIYKAPLGTVAPSSATSVLDAAFKDLGYLDEEGTEESWDDSVQRFVAWQNATVIRSATTDSVGTLKFTMLETKGNVLTTFYRGSTVVETPVGNWRLNVKPITADPSAWVLDVVDGLVLTRIYVGNGEITERGSIMYQNSAMVAYPVTLTFYPDSNGDLMVKHSNDNAWALV